jgi:hypothetical protein
MSLYYESHVTIEPVFDERLKQLKAECLAYGFRVADLLMKKRSADKAERSKHDTFCTGRDKEYQPLLDRTLALVTRLQALDFKVWRYKIEDALVDSKIDDSLLPLPRV